MRADKLPWAGALCLSLAVAHGVFAWSNRGRLPELAVLSPPPGQSARAATAMGDDQFLYRNYALNLQTTGDEGGRVTPIRNYNYDHVLGWLGAVATMDPLSNHYMLLAMRYFSYTPDPASLRRLVDFVVADVSQNPQRKWYWLTQAMEITDHRLSDLDYTLKISQQLASYDFPEMPTWVFLFPAVVLEKMGRLEEALAVLDRARTERAATLTQYDLNWMNEVSARLKTPK